MSLLKQIRVANNRFNVYTEIYAMTTKNLFDSHVYMYTAISIFIMIFSLAQFFIIFSSFTYIRLDIWN